MTPTLQQIMVRWGCRSVISAFGFMVVMATGHEVAAEYAGAHPAKPVVDPSLTTYTPTGRLSGLATIAGSDTMQPLIAKLAIEFRRLHPDVKFAIQGSRNHGESTVQPVMQAFLDRLANSRRGDGKTSGHFGSNDVQVLASSRQLTDKEIKQFVSRYGYEPTEIPIAQDAVAIYVHRDNPIAGLTLQQLDAIFSKTPRHGGEPVLTWGQVGLSEEWQHAPIHPYGRDKRSTGTRIFFQQNVLLEGEFRENVKAEPGSASIVLAVSQDPLAIGYSGIGFQSSSVRQVPLSERTGTVYIEPSAENVTSGTYPLSRQLYLYVNKAPDKSLHPVILEFLKFVNSQQGQQAVIKAGVYPLTPTQVARNLSTLIGAPLSAEASAVRMETTR
ncbi:MAG: PstS family phosphate ABC transporter substrate-binding protein [Nitrospiraceae bacterium]|nr:PstS family phosphate ABC transporter substrate-binding protein [Nitrospiraceae bacterium]